MLSEANARTPSAFPRDLRAELIIDPPTPTNRAVVFNHCYRQLYGVFVTEVLIPLLAWLQFTENSGSSKSFLP